MPSTRPRRAARLALALARHPLDIPRYATQGFRDTHSTTEMELPWFSFSAIRYLERKLTGSEVVYEYGGGGSTLFFARRVRRVVTVENDQEWLDELDGRLAARGLKNVELIHASADFSDPASFAESDFALALPSDPADVVLIDSYDVSPPHPLRPKLFPYAEERVKPGGMVVLDDSSRYRFLRHQSQAREVHTEYGTGPARRLATATDFYLY